MDRASRTAALKGSEMKETAQLAVTRREIPDVTPGEVGEVVG
jgi:hypothetical protein